MAYSTVLQEFLIRFGFRMDQMSANATLQSLGSIGGKLNAAARIGMFAFSGLSREIYRTSMEMANLQLSADRLGMSATSLDRILMAARAAGGNEGDALKSLAGLQSRIGEGALRIGQGSGLLRKFGITVFGANKELKSTEQILGEIAIRFRNLAGDKMIDPRVRNALARQFGITDDFARILASDFGEMLAVTTKLGEAFEYNMDKMGKSAAKFKKELGMLSNTFKIVRRTFTGDSLDFLGERLFRFNGILIQQAHGLKFWTNSASTSVKLLTGVLDAAVSSILRVVFGLGQMLSILGPLGTGLNSLIILIAGLSAVILPFVKFSVAALIPILTVLLTKIALVAAAILLLDDVMSYFAGNDTVFGPLYDFLVDILGLLPRVIGKFERFKEIVNKDGWIAAIFPKSKDNAWLKGFGGMGIYGDYHDDQLEELRKNLFGDKSKISSRNPLDGMSYTEAISSWWKNLIKSKEEAGAAVSDEDSFIYKLSIVLKDILVGPPDIVSKNQVEKWESFKKAVIDGFDRIVDALNIKRIIEAIKSLLWFGAESGSVRTRLPFDHSGEVNPETEEAGKKERTKIKKKILDNLDPNRANKEAEIDKIYGAPMGFEDSEEDKYSKHLDEIYMDRKGKTRKFGSTPHDKEAVKEDKYYADMVRGDPSYADTRRVETDGKVPGTKVDIFQPAEKEDDLGDANKGTYPSDLPDDMDSDRVTITPKPDPSKNSSWLQVSPKDTVAANNTVANNTNQNVVVNNTVNVSGAGQPQEVANAVIDQQYRVVTGVATVLKPYYNPEVYA